MCPKWRDAFHMACVTAVVHACEVAYAKRQFTEEACAALSRQLPQHSGSPGCGLGGALPYRCPVLGPRRADEQAPGVRSYSPDDRQRTTDSCGRSWAPPCRPSPSCAVTTNPKIRSLRSAGRRCSSRATSAGRVPSLRRAVKVCPAPGTSRGRLHSGVPTSGSRDGRAPRSGCGTAIRWSGPRPGRHRYGPRLRVGIRYLFRAHSGVVFPSMIETGAAVWVPLTEIGVPPLRDRLQRHLIGTR